MLFVLKIYDEPSDRKSSHLEFTSTAKLVHVVFGYLSYLEQTDLTLVVDDGTTFDVRFGLIGDLHDILSLIFDHGLHDVEIHDSAEIVNIGDEDVLFASADELLEKTGISITASVTSQWL